jgi:endonuclease YncB( thermonuclease family)
MLDQGLKTYRDMYIRFAGINAPELNTVEGKTARSALVAYLTDYAGDYVPLVIRTLKDKADKYGDRWDGLVWRETDGTWSATNQFVTTNVSANDWLVASGYAIQRTY